jgi:uncharacterized circularly permuted ATP-grasp superfamily protein
MIPRIITAVEWRRLSRGTNMVRALILPHDLYHRQRSSAPAGCRQMLGTTTPSCRKWSASPPGGVYTHIVGIDLVRTGPDDFMAEDNARTPSGVPHAENRETMTTFPSCSRASRCVRCRTIRAGWRVSRRLRARLRGRQWQRSPGHAADARHLHLLISSTPSRRSDGRERPKAATARGHGRIAMRTTRGYEPIDVIYRRVDDESRSAELQSDSAWRLASWTSTAPAESPSPTRRAPA